MTTTDPTTLAEEAAALVRTLEEQILNGEGEVSADDLANARKVADFAQLQAEAARRREHETKLSEAVTAAQDAATTLRDLLSQQADSRAADAALIGKAAKALDALLSAREQRYAAIREAARDYRLAAKQAESLGMNEIRKDCGVDLDADRDRIVVAADRKKQPYPYGSMADPSHAVRAVLEQAGIHLDRKASITSARKVQA